MRTHTVRYWLAFGDFDVAVTCGEFPTRQTAEATLADRRANGTAYADEHVMSGCRNCGGATPQAAILRDTHSRPYTGNGRSDPPKAIAKHISHISG